MAWSHELVIGLSDLQHNEGLSTSLIAMLCDFDNR